MTRLAVGLIASFVFAAGCSLSSDPLPSTLYFVQGREAEAQVWRLDRDAVTLTQLTDEPGGVSDFAVSLENGGLAIVTDNRLLLADSDGENRRLIADGNLVDPNIEDYVFRSHISSPEFSPDGRWLAYGFDGLHLYNLETGQDEHVLTNLGNLLGEPFVFTREVYVPERWSPDGEKLLIGMGYYEGDTLAIMEPGLEQPFRRIWSDGPVCCTYAWSSDSQYVLAANPYFTVQLPGLWRFDAQTGEETVVIPGLKDDNSINYVGWPHQLRSGELYFFYVHLANFSPDVGIPLSMARSAGDGTNLTQLRTEELRISGVLWAEDGSFAIVIHRTGEDAWQMVLLPSDGSELQILVEASSMSRPVWGP